MKTILLIEDEAPVADLIKSFLGVEYLVIHCQSGEAAIEQLKRLRPDLIILDMYLRAGGLSGLDTLSILHAKPEFKGVPIMVISGRADRYEIDHALLLGAVTFLSKPYSPARLMVEIEKLLGEPE